MALRALKTRRVHVLAEVLAQLAAGKAPYEIEHRMIKIMEEPNRRNPQGQVLPASPHIQAAASYLANELACMSNTLGSVAKSLELLMTGPSLGPPLRLNGSDTGSMN